MPTTAQGPAAVDAGQAMLFAQLHILRRLEAQRALAR
jgi:hypothetical protein